MSEAGLPRPSAAWIPALMGQALRQVSANLPPMLTGARHFGMGAFLASECFPAGMGRSINYTKKYTLVTEMAPKFKRFPRKPITAQQPIKSRVRTTARGKNQLPKPLCACG